MGGLATLLMLSLFIHYVHEEIIWSARFIRQFKGDLTTRHLGLPVYRADGMWAIAFDLDRQLPAAARGAMLEGGDIRFYEMNYMLFPRLLYPASPNVATGVFNDWKQWQTVAQVKESRLPFDFIVQDGRIVNPP